MSILQELQEISKTLTQEQHNKIKLFLKNNKQYSLSDIYYNKDIWNLCFNN